MDYIVSLLGPMADGAKVTLTLFFITLALAVPLGLVLALLRISRWRTISRLVNGYIWLMRGTPLMLQMLFIYFALPFVPVIGVRLPDFPAAVVAFALNYAAISPKFSARASFPLIAVSTKAAKCWVCLMGKPCDASCCRRWSAMCCRAQQRNHHPGPRTPR